MSVTPKLLAALTLALLGFASAASAAPSLYKATGGVGLSDGSHADFSVQSDGSRVKGELQFQSRDGQRFHGKTMDFLVQAACFVAIFTGVSAEGRSFQAVLIDGAAFGGQDLFFLSIDGQSVSGSGPVERGSFSLHCSAG